MGGVDYLLRVAGVNIYTALYDTTQLSVRRGAGLALRGAIQAVKKRLEQQKADLNLSSCQTVSIGASEGLFQLSPSTPGDAERVRDEVARYLSTDDLYRHFTFVVDCAPISSDAKRLTENDIGFSEANERALALNRCRQYRQPTLVPPPLNHEKQAGPCAWDNIRPGVKPTEWVRRSRSRHADLSMATAERHRFGRNQKKSEFFLQECDLQLQVTNDLGEIADNEAFGNLNGKLAVFYADGNRFGGLLPANPTADDLRAFDEDLRGKYRGFLNALLQRAKDDPAFKDGGKIRLEVLLWGGDEIMLVVPAWKGWELTNLFFHHTANWRTRESLGNRPMTHAAGLVFCHHKTPVQRIEQLARDLAEGIKERTPAEKPPANGFDYLVLESIDYPTGAIEDFRKQRYGKAPADKWHPLISGGNPEEAAHRASRLIEKAPRRQAFKLAAAASLSRRDFDQARGTLVTLRGSRKVDQWEAEMRALFPGNDEDRWLWLHLVELWDYLAPQAEQEQPHV